MKSFAPFAALFVVANLAAAEVPKVFQGLLEPDVPVKAQLGRVMPPPEIEKYNVKFEAAARKDPKWFREFFAKTKPGQALPFDEKLGLTKDEYSDYLVLWDKRDFKVFEQVMLMLRQSSPGTWSITATGPASVISTLRYKEKNDLFESPNGDLKPFGEIKTDAAGIVGSWSGLEWKFEEETGISKTQENFAIGRFEDNKHGLIIHHIKEVSSPEGKRILDKSIVVRFPLGKPSQVKPKPTTTTPAKPTKPPVVVKPKKPAPK